MTDKNANPNFAPGNRAVPLQRNPNTLCGRYNIFTEDEWKMMDMDFWFIHGRSIGPWALDVVVDPQWNYAAVCLSAPAHLVDHD